MLLRPSLSLVRSAVRMLAELPLDVMPITRSPGWERPSIWREKAWSKP